MWLDDPDFTAWAALSFGAAPAEVRARLLARWDGRTGERAARFV